MFGMRPTGFNSFNITPHLPEEWNHMALRNIHAFQNQFDLEITRTGKDKLVMTVIKGYQKKLYIIKEGATKEIKL
jgi:hypothetical protein